MSSIPADLTSLVLIVVVVLVVAVPLLFLQLRRSSRQSNCPQCGSARVPSRGVCPFCGAPYESTTTSPPPVSVPLLVGLAGPQKGRKVPLTGRALSIGRSTSNELVLEALLVSRRHAEIVYHQRKYIIYDRDSVNGTWVNGLRIVQHELSPGDQIRIGPSVLAFQIPGRTAHVSRVVSPRPVEIPSLTPGEARRRYDLRDYRLVAKLGKGQSVVWKAISSRDGTVVAVKILHQGDEYLRRKFEEEHRKGRILSHAHIIRVLDGGQTPDGAMYIIMEYADGGSLRRRLAPERPLPIELAIDVVGQTCQALSYAHSQGVIHRDIKPENILFSSEGGVKVADFGIAKWFSSPTQTSQGMLLGTPYYMSVEQARGQPVYEGSDVYALGVVLFEMVAGRPPFLGDALSVVEQHITAKPPSPREFNSEVPAEVERVVKKAMAKDRRKRFKTPAQFARALGCEIKGPSRVASAARRSEARGAIVTEGSRGRPLGLSGRGGRLKVVQTGRTIALGTRSDLGRDSVNRPDTKISRSHASVVRQGNQYWLKDLDSTNGTFLNGIRVFEKALLHRGDQIQLGETVLRVEME